MIEWKQLSRARAPTRVHVRRPDWDSPSVPFLLRSVRSTAERRQKAPVRGAGWVLGRMGRPFGPFRSHCQAAAARARKVSDAAGVSHHLKHTRRSDCSWRTAPLPAVTSIGRRKEKHNGPSTAVKHLEEEWLSQHSVPLFPPSI